MKIRQTIATTAILLATVGVSAASAATPIYTENFNDPAFVGSGILLNDTSDRWASTNYYSINDVDGWSFSGGAYLAVNEAAGPADGALLLNEPCCNTSGGVGVQSNISGLTARKKYDISLLLSGDNQPGQTYVFDGTIAGTGPTTSFTTTGVDQSAGTNPGTIENYYFTATDSTETLTLFQSSSTAASPIVDNIAVTAVPEPAIWAMMLFGFFGVGFMMRGSRRKQSGALAAA